MQKVYLFGIALLLAFASLSFASAGVPDDAIIRTIPAQSIWVADGVTEYRMDLYVDTTNLPNDLTSGIKWRVLRPQGLQSNIVMTRAELATQNYFFECPAPGYTIFTFGAVWSNQQIGSWCNLSPRQGYIGSYWFKVMPGVGKTSTSFNLNNVVFSDGTTPDPNPLPYHVENVPFTVTPRQATYTNAVVCDDLSC